MKKVIALLLVVALTAALSIGATLAYLTDTDEDVNVMTLGKVKIDQLEYERIDTETKDENATVQEFHDNKPLLPAVTENGFDYTPGDTYVDWEQIGKDGYTSEIWNPEKINNEVDKMVFVKNKGDYDAYVRTFFAFEAGKYTTLDEFRSMVHLNLNETDWTWEWEATPVTIGESTYFVANATYNKVLEPGALTEISLAQIALDKTATNEDVEAFGETYQVLVKTQAIQAQGFDAPAVALCDGFGIAHPFEGDNPIKGIDLKRALHNLNGDTKNVITTKVSNVVFGLNKDHQTIVDNYDGTLVDVEQDVPVYAYYVKDGSNYTVYVLANDDIYAPKDSTGLMKGMTALTAVDTSNINVSRVENAYQMFMNCSKLPYLDTTGWDTSNITDMTGIFYKCSKLAEIEGITDWDTSSCNNLYAAFYEMKALKELDLSGWDTGSLTNLKMTFRNCSALETINMTGWDMTKVTDSSYAFDLNSSLQNVIGSEQWKMPANTNTSYMFQNCAVLENLDVTNWDMSNVTTSCSMFKKCVALESLDVSKWNTGKITDFSYMFDCGVANKGNMQLKEITGTENWDVSSATTLNSMFYGCGNLTELNLSNWNMPNLINISHMFADCYKLKDINLSGWNTPSLVVMDAMFNNCNDLETIDVSSITTDNVKEFSQVFEYCGKLTKIEGLENWNTANGATYDEMFGDCHALKELDLSSFNTSGADVTYQYHYSSAVVFSDGFYRMFSGVESLEKLIVSDDIVYLGCGNVLEKNKLTFPAPAAKTGFTAKWRNVETGELYDASEIPEKTAATYEAYYEAIPTT